MRTHRLLREWRAVVHAGGGRLRGRDGAALAVLSRALVFVRSASVKQQCFEACAWRIFEGDNIDLYKVYYTVVATSI